uniref:Immunoglobulin V-set domain-containing protein n=1 Tax=Lates calcarifer TaxID=8187 RepID=A0A4W6BPN7_LATCA
CPLLSLSLYLCSSYLSESQTVKAQSGQESNCCAKDNQRSSCDVLAQSGQQDQYELYLSYVRSDSKAEYCDGYEAGNFQMRSNSSTVYLKIKQVNVSDSGQYFCGFYTNGRVTFTESQYLNLTSSKIIVKSFLSFHSHCSVMSFSVSCSVTVSIMYLILLLLKILLNLSKNA